MTDIGRNIPYIFRGRNLIGTQPIQIALTGDNISNRLTFQLDKVFNGVDLSGYTAQLILKGTFMPDPKEDIITETTGLSKTVQNGIRIVWTVGLNQTYATGTGTAQIRLIGSGGEVWQSDVFSLSVGSSLDVDGTIEDIEASVIVDHTAKILALEIKTADTTGSFPLKEDVYDKTETYSQTEVDALVADIPDLSEGISDLNTLLDYDSGTHQSGTLNGITDKLDNLETQLEIDAGTGNAMRLVGIEGDITTITGLLEDIGGFDLPSF